MVFSLFIISVNMTHEFQKGYRIQIIFFMFFDWIFTAI